MRIIFLIFILIFGSCEVRGGPCYLEGQVIKIHTELVPVPSGFLQPSSTKRQIVLEITSTNLVYEGQSSVHNKHYFLDMREGASTLTALLVRVKERSKIRIRLAFMSYVIPHSGTGKVFAEDIEVLDN